MRSEQGVCLSAVPNWRGTIRRQSCVLIELVSLTLICLCQGSSASDPWFDGDVGVHLISSPLWRVVVVFVPCVDGFCSNITRLGLLPALAAAERFRVIAAAVASRRWSSCLYTSLSHDIFIVSSVIDHLRSVLGEKDSRVGDYLVQSPLMRAVAHHRPAAAGGMQC